MNILIVYGWEKHSQRISFIETIRKEFGYGLKESKDIIDALADEKEVIFTGSKVFKLEREFKELGAKCKIASGVQAMKQHEPYKTIDTDLS